MQNRNDAVAAAENWIARYVRAWSTNDPDHIRALFTENAEYRDGPATAPWVGREAIVDAWLAQKDEPGTWSFAHELTAVDGDVAVIRGWTDYPTATEKARRYDNLMVIRLAEDGSAAMFTDWWVASQPSDS